MLSQLLKAFKTKPSNYEDFLSDEEKLVYKRTINFLDIQLANASINNSSLIPSPFILGYIYAHLSECVTGCVFEDGSISTREELLLKNLCEHLNMDAIASFSDTFIAMKRNSKTLVHNQSKSWGIGYEYGREDFLNAQLHRFETCSEPSPDNLARYLTGSPFSFELEEDDSKSFSRWLEKSERLEQLYKLNNIHEPVSAGMV